MNASRGDLRHLAAAMAGHHRAIAHDSCESWVSMAHKAIPQLGPMKRRSLNMAYSSFGPEREGGDPPCWILDGTESPEQVLGGRHHPGTLALAAYGLLVILGSTWDDNTLGDISESLAVGRSMGPHKTDFYTQPAFVLLGPGVPFGSLWRLHPEIILRGAPPNKNHVNKLAAVVARARERINHQWYVMSADRDIDAVTSRVARSLAAVDGAEDVSAKCVEEAMSIVWRPEEQEPTP